MAEQQKEKVDVDAQAWGDAIAGYEREFKKWESRSEKIIKKYRDYDQSQGAANTDSSFNILWSNVQVQLPAVFSRLPKPDVSRRFRDTDPVGRVACLLLERGLEFEIDHYANYRSAMEACVLDRFLGGRGQAWVRYEPHFSPVEAAAPAEAEQITEDAGEGYEAAPDEEITKECAPVDYVNWKDFGHTIARTWEEVTAVWRRVYLDRKGLVARFGEEVGATIPLDTKPTASTSSQSMSDVEGKQACIYEIWDKSTGTALWFSKSLMRIIEEKPDPLGLTNFFPCPRPLYSTITNESLVPIPDYKYYQDQAKQLTKLQAKIDGLIDMMEVRGVYDASVPELARMFKEAGNGNLIAAKNWAAFSEKNGLAGSIDIFDIAPIVNALNVAYDQLDKVKNTIYELMGISDITRGASDPNETYGAQKLKGQYGNMRLRNQQARVTQFATELLQIKAEVMCKHFQPQTILKIAAAGQLDQVDQQLLPQALELLLGARATDPGADTADGPLAGFRVEVSTDSMIQMDEAQEKADRTEFLTAIGSFIQQALPVMQTEPQAGPLLVGLLKFGISGFKVGKTLEGMLDNTLDQMMKQAQQPPPKPDPEMAKVQAQMALEDKKLANAQQLHQQQTQSDAALAAHEQQVQAQQNAHQNALEAERAQQQAELDARLEQQRMQFDHMLAERESANAQALEQVRAQVQTLIAAMNNANKLEVAELAAQTTLDAAQVSAAQAATNTTEND